MAVAMTHSHSLLAFSKRLPVFRFMIFLRPSRDEQFSVGMMSCFSFLAFFGFSFFSLSWLLLFCAFALLFLLFFASSCRLGG